MTRLHATTLARRQLLARFDSSARRIFHVNFRKLTPIQRSSPDLVFRDSYVLDFLGLKDTYAERDLEAVILREMESFLLELEKGDIRVASYWTKLLPRAALARKLHQAVRHARLSLSKVET